MKKKDHRFCGCPNYSLRPAIPAAHFFYVLSVYMRSFTKIAHLGFQPVSAARIFYVLSVYTRLFTKIAHLIFQPVSAARIFYVLSVYLSFQTKCNTTPKKTS